MPPPATTRAAGWIRLLLLLTFAPFSCVACGHGISPRGAEVTRGRAGPGQIEQIEQIGKAGEIVAIDTGAKGRPFRHFWETTFGSGRSILSLRESYRRDLRRMRSATGIGYVRFHDIFHDDVGVYDE